MKKLGHLFYRAFHNLDFAGYIPMVSLTYSSALYTSCKLIVGARDLNRFRFDFVARILYWWRVVILSGDTSCLVVSLFAFG